MPIEGNELKISVVLPVHNGEKYLKESVDSILCQTYRNFELIIVDDLSTDSSPQIISEFARKDSRIHVVTNEKNLKLPGSLNRGFHEASGDMFTWTSDDNIFMKNAFEEMVSFFEENPFYDFVFTKIAYIDENGNYCGEADYIDGDLSELPLSNCIGACFMYKKIVHERLKGYDEKKFLVEDYDYWLRVYREFNIGFIPITLYKYRNHGDSLTATRMEEILAGKIGLYEDELKWDCFSQDIKIRICKEVADYYYKHNKFRMFRKYMGILKKYSKSEYEAYKEFFDKSKLGLFLTLK